MTAKSFPVEVQPDFLERQAKSRPLPALAEFIWNALDADADTVRVFIESTELGMTKIIVSDNGHGIPHEDAPDLFTKLGGSWKKRGGLTKTKQRMLHGYEGRGRFKAFALGRVVDWHVTYQHHEGSYQTYDISMLENNIREVRITDEKEVFADSSGVEVVISELHRNYPSLESEDTIQDLSEIFALYLQDYRDIGIIYQSVKLDPTSAIATKRACPLSDLNDEGESYPVRLEIIEWKTVSKRALYLCNEQGFPFSQVSTRFHIGQFQFSAYLKSPFIAQLHEENQLELAEMNPLLVDTIAEARETIKDYFRGRASESIHTVVEEWKAEHVYPYEGEAETPVEQVERQVFDIVAVSVNDYLPDFASSPPKNKAFHLRILRQAIENSPEELQLILNEVLDLPKRKQEELAQLLQEVSLTAVISASKLVADRLKFITGLETLLFNADLKKHIKERSQLHRILAQNTWIFGEEFNLSVDDRSLTEVLRKHKGLIGEDTIIDRPVKHPSQKRGIVDLMLSRAIRRHRHNELEHLIIELKAPKVVIGSKEIVQTEQYAIAVATDERFRSIPTRWTFWVLSDDMDVYAQHRIVDDQGIISSKDDITIGIKTWSQIIEENKARLQFFQEKLEHQVDQGTALKYLQEKHQELLTNVITDDVIERFSEGPASQLLDDIADS